MRCHDIRHHIKLEFCLDCASQVLSNEATTLLQALASRVGASFRRSALVQITTPLLAVDCVAFDWTGCVILVKRRHSPFQSRLALPGGFVEIGETVENACRREFYEETGLNAGRLNLVGVYSDPERDPRGHVVSVAFASVIARDRARAGDDAEHVEWVCDWFKASLAFDHQQILIDASRTMRRRRKIQAASKARGSSK